MSLDDLPIESYEERISTFMPQTQEDMCYSASLRNLLEDVGQRNQLPSLKFSLSQMNRKCGYQRGMYCNEKIIPKVIDDICIKVGYKWKDTTGPGNTIDTLRDITLNKKFSLALVNVSNSYFQEIGWKEVGRSNEEEHVLIIMGVDHNAIYFYDPYESFFKRSSNIASPPRHLPLAAFLRLWDTASTSRWMAWAEPEPTKQSKLPLEDN